MLNIVNGEVVADLLEECGLPGDILSYDDVLHEGPTPSGLTHEAWREKRAEFHTQSGWSNFDAALKRLEAKDKILFSSHNQDMIILWYEHDLYDQLLIINLCAIFAELLKSAEKSPRISLICIGSFPGIERFYGLGQLYPQQIASLYDMRKPLSAEDIAEGAEVWRAFCSDDPRNIEPAILKKRAAFPFLNAALQRHLEQFPSLRNGLSRTERQILETLTDGAMTPKELFLKDKEREESPFMGDWTFYKCLARLIKCKTPAVIPEDGSEFRQLFEFSNEAEFEAQRLAITKRGAQILRGAEDFIALNGIDRWLGGVHLKGENTDYRYDEENKKIVRINR